MSGQLAFAFVAGTVATANPCGFALLPAYLARQLGLDARRSRGSAATRALAVGGLTTSGFLLVFGTVGAGISLGARGLIGVIPWLALAIGVLLFAAGVAVLAGRRIALRIPLLGRRDPDGGPLSVFLFGIGYGVASLSCTLPIFLAVIGTSLGGAALGGVLAFAAYAAGMGTVLTALAVAAALSGGGLVALIRRALPYVSKAGGAMLAAAGLYVTYYWSVALLPGVGDSSASPVIRTGNRLSAEAQEWLSSGTGQTVSVAVAVALGLLLLVVLLRPSGGRARREQS